MAGTVRLTKMPRRRRLVNSMTRLIVGLGGAGVIAAIVLIFFYLLWVVAPVFSPAGIEPGSDYPLSSGDTLLVTTNETDEVGLRITRSGDATFFGISSDLEGAEQATAAVSPRSIPMVC